MKILYIQPLHEAGMARLAERYTVCVAPDTRRETLLQAVADADVLITRLTPLDAELLAAGKRLKAVAKHGVGVDNIDTTYCANRGIAVLTTGDANSVTVAEHAMLAIGALFKRIAYLDRAMRRGDWAARDQAGSFDLEGRMLGIVGFGRIGRHLARMASQGFGMLVGVFDPYVVRADIEAAGCEAFDDLDDLLAQADAISPHVPLTRETRHLLDGRRLSLMKPGALVINFARGGVVCEEALEAALASGQIGGAAL
ncbi:MAG TPA: NAD(P)-dependent oxidoreductase, partial [Clostridia bacterium]|nr:NAD(P)-dependent oxidoreductase [Clostridia bacterium]